MLNDLDQFCALDDEREGENLIWSINNSSDVFNQFKSKSFKASKLSHYSWFLHTVHYVTSSPN